MYILFCFFFGKFNIGCFSAVLELIFCMSYLADFYVWAIEGILIRLFMKINSWNLMKNIVIVSNVVLDLNHILYFANESFKAPVGVIVPRRQYLRLSFQVPIIVLYLVYFRRYCYFSFTTLLH